MILVGASIWVDHFRRGDRALAEALERAQVLGHPLVIGELACGGLAQRSTVLDLLLHLPQAAVAEHDEALAFIDLHALHGRGIGFVDVQLLASAALTSPCRLWTRDRRLHEAASALGLAHAA